MKYLVVHPEDPSTNFLCQIYAHLSNKTVAKGDISKSELRKLMESHDRILMMGHGSPYGLLSQGRFPDSGGYIIDDSIVQNLRNKNNLFIWCFADQFVRNHMLSGINTGMFISQKNELDYYDVSADEDLINQSNERFSMIISKHIDRPITVLFRNLICEYELVARTNPIAKFNLERLCITRLGKRISVYEPY